jgi:hypothetical protein
MPLETAAGRRPMQAESAVISIGRMRWVHHLETLLDELQFFELTGPDDAIAQRQLDLVRERRDWLTSACMVLA